MRIGQTSVLLSLSKYFGSFIAFLTTLYFARELGAEVLGYYSLVLIVTKWFALSGEVGISTAVNKRISEAEEPSAYYSAGILLGLGLGCVLVAVIVLLRESINSYVGIDTWVFVAVMTPLSILYSITGASLMGERRVHLVAYLTPTQTISRSLTQIGLVVVGYGLTGMIFGYIAGLFLAAALGLWFISLEFEMPTKDKFKRIYSFAKYSWLGSLKGRSFNDVDVMVLGALVSPQLVGIYSVAWGITNFIGIFGSSIQNTLFPELSYANSTQQTDSLGSLISDSLTYSGLVAIPGVFGSLIVADRLLRIYGGEFTRGVAVLSLLILAMLIYDYQNQLLNGLNAVDRPGIAFRVNATFIAVNLVLNVALVYAFGWVGAAVATVIAASIGLVVSFRYLRTIADFEVPISELGRQLAAALTMALVVGAIRLGVESTVSSIHNTVFVVALILLGAGVYFTTLYAISIQFRTTIRNNSPVELPTVL
ncbi:oligosaccharide flippase family protein [Halohasta salina]|uniref:oligosaccharide flippase family protein n=1 Tax=Halohasta salina TaxID=2961621 RepID=UPI0020A5291F|nr:oligosaccharide flippase family protein [Halohasta salina]